MIRKNQIVQSLDPTMVENCCGCQPMAEPIVPPVVPIVSVRSVDGMTGDVELKKLTIGSKEYDGSQDVVIYPVDFGFEGTVNYRGWTTSETILVTPVEIGDLYYASDKLEFWLAIARGDGAGVFKTIPTVDFLAPYAFIKETASQIELRFTDVEQSYTFFAVLKDKLGNEIYTSNELDLPIEQLVKEIKYDHENRSLIFVLQSGKEISVSLMELVNTLQEKITPEKKLAFDLVDGLTDFQVRVDATLTTLQNDLAAEILRSTSEEAKLDKAIKDEVTARIEAVKNEAELRYAAVQAEKDERISTDDTLNSKIAINATAIKTEHDAREAADTKLTTDLETEAHDRTVADQAHDILLATHTSKLKTLEDTTIPAINDAITAEQTARVAADNGLSTRIKTLEDQTLDTRLKYVEQTFPAEDALIRSEFKAADTQIKEDYKAADDALTTKITAEETARKGEDTNIRNEFATADNTVRAEFAEADDAIKVRVKAIEEADFQAQINNEKSVRAAADTALDSRIDTTITNYQAADTQIIKDYKAADTTLQTNIDKVAADLATETTRAIGAEGTLTSALNTEADRAEEAEETLTRNLGKEVQDRIAGDTAVETKLNTEISNRVAAVASEEEARKAQDEILANYIKAEKDAREAADTTLNTKLSTEETRAKAAEEAEVARAKAAEEAEVTRATVAEATLTTNKVTVLPKVDDPTDPDYGQAYHMLYNVEATPDASKIDITVKTITLDNNFTKQSLARSIPGATQTTAGLLSAADKVKLDNAVTETGLADEITRAKAREDAIELGYQTADSALSTRIDAIHVAEYTMIKDASSSEYAAVYHLTKDGVNQGVEIDIPKDQMLKDVKTGTCTTEDVPEGFHVGEHYIELIFDTASGEVKRYIKVEDVIKPYTGSATITISSDNVISLNADVKATIDATESGLAQEIVDRKAEDQALNVVIGNEISRAIAREEDLQDQIDQLDIDIKAEATRAKAAEATLTTNLNNEITRATTAETTLTTNLNKEIQDRIDDVNAEEIRATGVEATITSNLNSEITRATDAENTLQSNINTEKSRAESAEATITGNLNSEITRATGAEGVLQTNINNEVTRATGAEDTLTTNLNSEITRATDAEGVLRTSIAQEVTDRKAAITQEVTDRNTAISTAIAQEVTDRNAAINTAITALDAVVSTVAASGYAITSIEEVDGKLTKINSTKITIDMVDGLQDALDALSARIKALEDLKLTFTNPTV